jgi:hypothetical protein
LIRKTLMAATIGLFSLAGMATSATLDFTALPAVSVDNPIASNTVGKVVENNPHDITNVRIGPWAGTPNGKPGKTQNYTSVAPKGKDNGVAEYVFQNSFRKLSFVWGTPDKYNTVNFYRTGAGLIDTVVGFGDGSNIALPKVAVTDIGDGLGFDRVEFVSTGTAFEYANLVASQPAPVPVPAAGLLLLTALGAVSLMRKRKTV